MIVTTAEESKAIDKAAMEEGQLPEEVLMENAGSAVIRLTKPAVHWQDAAVVIVAGTGNNGGDGFVAARYALEEGSAVVVLLIGQESHMSRAARMYKNAAEKAGISIIKIEDAGEAEPYLIKADIIVDALIGTGLSRAVAGEKAKLITLMNNTDAVLISVDIPSGLSADGGYPLGEAVCADITVALNTVKRGHVLYPGKDYVGTLFYSKIGIPDSCRKGYPVHEITAYDVATWLPVREETSHKGNHGTVGLVAGSLGLEGAALLSAEGALYGGAGKVCLLTAEKVTERLAGRIPEVMVSSLGGQGILMADALPLIEKRAENMTVLAVGPGIGRNKETQDLVASLLANYKGRLVLDADALYAAAEQKIGWDNKEADIVITPHVGEFARLTGHSPEDIEKNRIEEALFYAVENQVTVVLKGAPTVVALKDGRAWVNSTGNPGMATGGMGDVLTGLIASLIGQGMSTEKAAIAGVYLHGFAADQLAEKRMVGMTAGEVAAQIPYAREKLYKNHE